MLVKVIANQKNFPLERIFGIACVLGEPGLGAESEVSNELAEDIEKIIDLKRLNSIASDQEAARAYMASKSQGFNSDFEGPTNTEDFTFDGNEIASTRDVSDQAFGNEVVVSLASKWHQSHVLETGILVSLEQMKRDYLMDGSLPEDPSLANLVVEAGECEKVKRRLLRRSNDPFFMRKDGRLKPPSMNPQEILTGAFQSARSQALLSGGSEE